MRSLSHIASCFRANCSSVTEEVQDYILYYRYEGVLYEIHLVDTPGFDDGHVTDAPVLSRIAAYVNTIFKLKKKLARVLYLHDITKAKVGGAALRNLRMLEQMIGESSYDNCTLVTTKWGCSNSPQDEEEHEKTLSGTEKYFGAMLQKGAKMMRFHPKTKESALKIITPYLKNKFTLYISYEMVDPHGPKLALGETRAGKIVADNVENVKKLAQTKMELAKNEHAQEILKQEFDVALFDEFNQKRKKLRRKVNMQKSFRWVMRITIVGGSIAATVLTLGPGASTFVLEPMFEKVVRPQKKEEKKAWKDLKADFARKSQNASALKNTDPNWIFDKHVKQPDDLERYSLKSGRSELDVMEVAKQGKMVGFATSDSLKTTLDLASLAASESSEESECDDESLGFDLENLSILP